MECQQDNPFMDFLNTKGWTIHSSHPAPQEKFIYHSNLLKCYSQNPLSLLLIKRQYRIQSLVWKKQFTKVCSKENEEKDNWTFNFQKQIQTLPKCYFTLKFSPTN